MQQRIPSPPQGQSFKRDSEYNQTNSKADKMAVTAMLTGERESTWLLNAV